MGKDGMFKSILAIVLLVCAITIPVLAKYSGGSGDPCDPYQIATPEDLNDIGNHPEDFNKSFIMTADIDMAGIEYKIIGIGTSFTGVFDGNNHEILNTRNAIFYYAYGDNVAIKNVGLVDVNIQSGAALVLMFEGMNTGTVSNCYVKGGTVTGESAGGLISYGGSGRIMNCYTTCDVSSTSGAGGIVCIWDGFSFTISNCYSSGTITALDRNCGGITGENWGGHIYRCYSTGNIQSSGADTGGIAGYNTDGTIEQCWSTSNVTDTGPDGATGGLVGFCDAWMGNTNVINCYARGAVTGSGYTGGLVGENWAFGGNATIENCYSTGHVIGTGGLIGQSLQDYGTAYYIGSFWDVNTSGQPTSAGGTGKTTAEMQTKLMFYNAGWDFNDVWKIIDGVDYPTLLSGLTAKYSGGSGEPNDPYQISNVVDLLTLAADVNDYNKCFILTADIDLGSSGAFTTAVIARDTDNSNYSFEGVAFTGIFDGAGHKIINLTIDTSGSPNSYLGLFGYVSGGEIKNLGLQNISITDGNDSSFIGGLVGSNVFGNIINCFSIGTVTGGDYSQALGGLVGYSEQGSISKCYSKGDVIGGECLGGLVGLSFGSTFNTSINNCFSTVNVTGGDYSECLGGLTGWSGGSISHCYATGAVAGGINSYSWALGGLAGGNQGDINNCFATGAVTSILIYSRYLGGLVGWSDGGISNCFSTGDVTGGDYAYYVGGLVGTNGWVSINDSYSRGAVTGGDYSQALGGLVGGNGTSISNCYSTGAVTGWDILGGLLGWNDTYGIINGSYFLNTSGPNNGYGAPLMEAQMKQQANFVGWDFAPIGPNDIWTIKETVDYPKLVWPMVNLVSSRFPLGWYEVDFADFAIMANWWGHNDCSSNNDCNGADFDFSGTVDIDDVAVMCKYWLQGH